MNPKEIAEKEREMREKYPDMFNHPELKDGEVYIHSGIVCDAADAQVAVYKSAGLTSARLGKAFLGKLKGLDGDFNFHPIFANLEEVIIVEDKYNKEKKRSQR